MVFLFLKILHLLGYKVSFCMAFQSFYFFLLTFSKWANQCFFLWSCLADTFATVRMLLYCPWSLVAIKIFSLTFYALILIEIAFDVGRYTFFSLETRHAHFHLRIYVLLDILKFLSFDLFFWFVFSPVISLF